MAGHTSESQRERADLRGAIAQAEQIARLLEGSEGIAFKAQVRELAESVAVIGRILLSRVPTSIDGHEPAVPPAASEEGR